MANLLDSASILLTPTATNNGSILAIQPSDGSGDMTFSRGSSATRVNEQGLIEDVQILSSNLVSNGDFSQGGQDWTLESSWSIGDNVVIASGASSNLAQISLTSGVSYKLTYKVVTSDNNNLLGYLGGNVAVSIPSTVGTHTVYGVSDGAYFVIRNQGFNGSITNISILEITDDTNLPRIDYTDGCGSLLLEPQSTNLITQSELFSDASWTKENVTVQSNTEKSPSGQLNASYVIPNIGSVLAPRITYVFSSQSGVTYQASVFVKKFNTDWIRLLSTGATSDTVQAYYDISNGVIGTGDSPNLATIEDYGNGWYRLGLKIASTNISSGATFRVQFAGGDGNPIITTNGTEKFICWGAMLENQSFSTSYIPTSGVISTRLQDIANNSGNASLINSEEGVLYAEISALADDGTNRRISIAKDANNKINMVLSASSNTVQAIVISLGSVQFNQSYVITDTTSFFKVAIKYKENDFALWINGVEVAVDTSGNTFTSGVLNKLVFNNSNGSNPFYGKTKAVAVFPYLTDEQLTALTTI